MFQRCYNGVRLVDAPSPDNVRRLDFGAIPMVMRMQENGILIDPSHFASLSKYLQSECERITEEIRKMTGYLINVGSPDQVAELLFTKIGIKPPQFLKKTGSGKRFSVNDEALSGMKDLHSCIPLIQQYNECSKLENSYCNVLPTLTDENNRIHSTLKVTRQVSGRISSSDPNLMAQPTRTDLGRRIRNGFVAGKGKKLGTIDQSQIEMRVAAHRSNCISMIDTFLRDGDIHVETATRIFFPDLPAKLGHMPSKKEAKEAGMDDMKHRYPAKRIGFGVLFGITESGLRDQIVVASDPSWTSAERMAYIDSWSEKRCEETIVAWFDVYSEIREYMQEEHSKVRRYGHACDMWGRIRLLPEVKSVHRRLQMEGLRACGSHGIQSSAQGTIKLAMAEIWDTICREKLPIEPILQIHDELLFEGDEDAMDECLNRFGEIMERCVMLSVPIRWNAGSGYDWGSLEK